MMMTMMTLMMICPLTATTTCKDNQFRCSNNLCIPRLFVCDRQDDCGDESDELNCSMFFCLFSWLSYMQDAV